MKYPKKTGNGDAGEYFVAYTITRLFGWPCRLFDVDIGVDAELEILDDKGISTGDVIKIQVKSFKSITKSNSKRIYVDDRHINYWKRFSLPVIVCCVDLSLQKIYWKQILSTETYQSGGVSNAISFDLVKDELNISSKTAFRSLAMPEASKEIEPLFHKLDTLYKELQNMGTPTCVDEDDLTAFESKCDAIYAVIGDIESLILHFPWRVGAIDLGKLAVIKRNIRITLNDASRSYNVGINGM